MRFSLIFITTLLCAQSPGYELLTGAYQALKAGSYEQAIAGFEKALALDPGLAAIHKDAAYACLKIGENRVARGHFKRAIELNPADYPAALEYAFLSFEAPDHPIPAKAEARRVFDRVRHQSSNPAAAATAEQAFQNIDKPLAEGIARWSAALAGAAPTFSVHHELAELAEQRDNWDLAAEHYLAAWHLEPRRKSVLVSIGRVERSRNRPEQATAALLAASRGGEPYAADQARELLPVRYPYVYEFRNAIALDPANTELHRELAYLLLSMEQKADAEVEFAHIAASDPADLLTAAQLGFLLLARGDRNHAMPLLTRVLKGGDEQLANSVRTALNLPHELSAPVVAAGEADARVMYERSYRAGYLQDALRYLKLANEANPEDYAVILKMGWTYNLLHQDRNALDWFRRARESSDPEVAGEAKHAFNNLRPEFARIRMTGWLLPFYSTRWHDAFSYGQVKAELRLDSLQIRPYLSVRFIGDKRLNTPGPNPQSLSESSFLLAAGVSTRVHGVTLWGEAGRAVSYTTRKTLPDYRGGASWARGWGRMMSSEASGLFLETNADEVFLSRFGNDLLTYSQWRGGWTQHGVQFLWNANVTVDTKRQYWANLVETGPGIRFRVPGAPAGLLFSVSGFRGAYLVNFDNPHHPNFFDLRAGFWYAFTH
jgi:tetratricopeptide (TPR) repeat protein